MHLCLVSDQPVPSLAPLVDPALGARQAVLAFSPQRERHARWLAAALQDFSIETELAPLADGFDLPALRREFAALADRFPDGLTVNITGGAKPMTIAAWETFSRPVDRVYYIDIRTDSLRWLRPEEPEMPVSDRIRLEPYLTAHGLRPSPYHSVRRDPADAAYLDGARRALSQLLKSKSLRTSAGGHWLEELVFAEVVALTKHDRKVQDYAAQLVVSPLEETPDGPVVEVDIAVLRDNTLYLIECKTGSAGRNAAASSALYKLAKQVDALGGLRGKGVFVSSEPVSEAIKARARLFGIALIDRPGLGDLRHSLASALSTAKPLS